MIRLALLLLAGAAVADRSTREDPDPERVDFARQIRPILAQKCFDCHGPDDATREADLRLDSRDGMFGAHDGFTPVVAKKLDESEVWLRISDTIDPMPPESSGKTLTADEIELVRRWIEEGAEWSGHWAFEEPVRPEPPAVEHSDWPRNDIDRFALARIEAEGMSTSPEADRASLLRRVTLDLTGLPPTLEELDAFLADTEDGAYEKVVERLLASPRYGERQAQEWLDLARYADSNGDGYDGTREMWKWREWVIRAFNDNKPFDEFTVEQIAGDLLPNATREQRLATGFHRNHTIFTKGGATKDEYRHAYVVDRVNTTATVWMGQTLGCAQCHDHKYDPFTQKEYYRLYAYFNNVSEKDVGRGRGNTPPYMLVPDDEQAQQLNELEGQIGAYEAMLSGDDDGLDAEQAAWAEEVLAALGEPVEWKVVEPIGFLSLGGSRLQQQEDGSILATGPSPAQDAYHLVAQPGTTTITALRLEVLPHESFPKGGSGRSEKGTFGLDELEVYASSVLQSDGGERIRFHRAEDDVEPERQVDADKAVDWSDRTGWSMVGSEVGEAHEAVFVPIEPLEMNQHSVLRFVFQHKFRNYYRNTLGRFRLSYTDDERVRKRRVPIVPSHWHSVGPFAAKTAEEALATVFEPEKEIPTGVDLEAKYAKVTLEKKGGEGKGGAKEAGSKPGPADAARGESPKPEGDAPPAERGGDRTTPTPASRPPKPAADEGATHDAAAVPTPPETEDGPELDFADIDPEDFADFDPADFVDFDPAEFQAQQKRGGKAETEVAWKEQESWRDGGRLSLSGKSSAWYVHRKLESERERDVRVLFEGVSAVRAWVDGKLVFEKEAEEVVSFRRPEFGGDDEAKEKFARTKPDYDWFETRIGEGESTLVLKLVTGEKSGGARVRVQALGRDVLSYATERALVRLAGGAPATTEVEPVEASAPIERPAGETKGGPNADEMVQDPVEARAGRRVAAETEPSADESRRERVRTWFRRHVSETTRGNYSRLDHLRYEKKKLEAKLPTCMVLDEANPRETHVLVRGAYDQKGEKVERGVPSVLPPLSPDAPPNRLGLAQWLVSGEHPLAARVTVNRVWRQYFGNAIVDTTDDFGTRGALPTHPDLLDWLACELVDSGWDTKALHRMIVTSATYRQASEVTAAEFDRDPDNRLLARGPRLRLSAEMIRDNALSVAGLLHQEIGGESVKPYQPKGLWKNAGGFGGGSYKQDSGEKLYRRGLYVFWKRGVLYPSFDVFDAPPRATCASERVETNTPLQSLVLLNDPVFVEAARGLGARMMTEGGSNTTSRLLYGFRLCTSRLPTQDEIRVLLRVFGEQDAHYAGDVEAAKALISVGESAVPTELDPSELAAWTAMGNLLLNLDATIHGG